MESFVANLWLIPALPLLAAGILMQLGLACPHQSVIMDFFIV